MNLLDISSDQLYPASVASFQNNKYLITFQTLDGTETISQDLEAMTPYQLIVTLDVISQEGNYAPISLKTISTNVEADYSQAIVYDSNPTFTGI